MPQEEGQRQAKAGDEGAEQPVTQPLLARNEPACMDTVSPCMSLAFMCICESADRICIHLDSSQQVHAVNDHMQARNT